MIEILAWCPDRPTFVQGMTTTYLPVQIGVDDQGNPIMGQGPALCTLADDGTTLIPLQGIAIDEIGPIVKTPAVLDEDGNVVTPAVIVEGWHVNLGAYGDMESMLTAGLPQCDADGNLLPLWDRTIILTLIPGLTWVPADDVPGGYVGPNGVRLFDPATVAHRRRVWFGV